jgi:hypothetical protein
LEPLDSSDVAAGYKLARHVAQILQPEVELAPSYIRNSAHFVDVLKQTTLQPGDILVSFDIVSLFTKIPITDTLRVIEQKFGHNTAQLARACLTTTYFQFNGKFYKQLEGAPMGSPISPAAANTYLVDFEERALTTAPLRPTLWLRYVDDTFVIWSHGIVTLHQFLHHLNSIHENIQFTMEVEEKRRLPFLDVLVEHSADNKLTHTVYRKATHTDRYLHAESHHHPGQKKGVLYTLAHRSKTICDPAHLNNELDHLHKALGYNGYSYREVQLAINRDPRPPAIQQEEDQEQRPPRAFLPYVAGVTDRISRQLNRRGFRTIFTANQKLKDIIRSPKDKIPLHTEGIYKIPCKDCSHIYIGQTKRLISTRREEHRKAVEKKDDEKSALAAHHKATQHSIDFDKTRVIAPIRQHGPRLVREAIEINKASHTMNRKSESGLSLSTAWKPLLARLKERHSSH